MRYWFAFAFLCSLSLPLRSLPAAKAVEAPRLVVQKDGRYALMVEGKPYLISGRPDSQFQRVAQRNASGLAIDGGASCEYRRGARSY